MQSNLSLIIVIYNKIPTECLQWVQGIHLSCTFLVLQNTGSQIQQSKLLNTFAGLLCLMLAASMPGVSDISHSLSFPYLTLLTPIVI